MRRRRGNPASSSTGPARRSTRRRKSRTSSSAARRASRRNCRRIPRKSPRNESSDSLPEIGLPYVYQDLFDMAPSDGSDMPSAFDLIGHNPALQEHWIRRFIAFLFDAVVVIVVGLFFRSEEHTSELQSPC